MMSNIYYPAKSAAYKMVAFSGLVLSVVACSVTGSQPSQKPQIPSQHAAQTVVQNSATDIGQIGVQTASLKANQINQTTVVDQLTIDQLRAYSDRCSPQANLSAPKGLDCSELSLRVKRIFNTDDKVTEALITLDRLGRNDTLNRALEGLENGLPGQSLKGQAIAGGLVDPAPPPMPTEPEENLEDFLNQNGLSINAGAIIQNPQ